MPKGCQKLSKRHPAKPRPHPKTMKREFYVENIVAKKVVNGKTMFLIKWYGYPSSQNTWEPINHIDVIEKFQREQKRADRPKTIRFVAKKVVQVGKSSKNQSSPSAKPFSKEINPNDNICFKADSIQPYPLIIYRGINSKIGFEETCLSELADEGESSINLELNICQGPTDQMDFDLSFESISLLLDQLGFHCVTSDELEKLVEDPYKAEYTRIEMKPSPELGYVDGGPPNGKWKTAPAGTMTRRKEKPYVRNDVRMNSPVIHKREHGDMEYEIVILASELFDLTGHQIHSICGRVSFNGKRALLARITGDECSECVRIRIVSADQAEDFFSVQVDRYYAMLRKEELHKLYLEREKRVKSKKFL